MNESFKMVKYYFKVSEAMNRLVIPSILAATLLLAGMFAFMPVQKASTVHTTIQANTLKPDSASATATTNDDDFSITCPTNSNGCIIYEVFLDDDEAGQTVDIDDIVATISTETFTVVADADNAGSTADETLAVNGIGNFAMAGGDVVKVRATSSGAGFAYSLRVVALVEGGETIQVARIADGT